MYELNNWVGGKHLRKRLRKESTKAEQLLWFRLRRKQLGYKFRRQHGFHKYILDFYCPELLLAIEVDGSVHGEKAQKRHDEIRQKYLEDNFINVFRFRNEQVFKELDSVVLCIRNECEKLKEH